MLSLACVSCLIFFMPPESLAFLALPNDWLDAWAVVVGFVG
jgi:hypothetical protein